MAFTQAMKSKQTVVSSKGMTLTENGALSHASTGCDRLNYFSKVLRDSSPEQVVQFLNGSWQESPLDAMKLVAQKRDCRGGSGEKKVFYESMRWVIAKYPDAAESFLPLIPNYGTWKDGYMCFCDTALEESWLKFVANQLKKDLAVVSTNDADGADDKKNVKDGADKKKHASVSLCAKWAPSEKCALSSKFPGVYDRLIKAVGLKAGNKGRKDFRKSYLTPLREYIDIVERLMCGGQWNDIQYKNVPSVAMKRLRKAFDRNDKERFKTYLDNVSKGKEKINSGQLFPHDMVKVYMSGHGAVDAVIEEQWKAYVKKTLEMGQLDKAVVLSDVSGSMNGQPMEVSIALGLLIATVAKGPFKGNVMTFETNPKFHHIDTTESLHSQVASLRHAPWGGSTNFQAAFDLILSTANEAKLKQEDMPKTLVVISDMQFNQADGGDNFFTNFETIKAKYRASGYDMPKIVFWNVRGATEDFPVTKDEYGVCLVSGFTPCHLKFLVSGVITTPYDLMRDTLDSERYKPVTVPAKYGVQN